MKYAVRISVVQTIIIEADSRMEAVDKVEKGEGELIKDSIFDKNETTVYEYNDLY